MKKRFAIAAASTMLSLMSFPAMAQWSAGAEFGLASASLGGSYSMEYMNDYGGTVKASQDNESTVVRLFGNYELQPGLAAEVGYSFSGDFKGSGKGEAADGDTVTGSGSASYKALDASVMASGSLLGDKLPVALHGLYLRGGLHYSWIEAPWRETWDDGATQERYSGTLESDKVINLLVGVGYEYPIGPGYVRGAITNYMDIGDEADVTTFTVGYRYKF